MDNKFINDFLLKYSEKFPEEEIPLISDSLTILNEDAMIAITSAPYKDYTTALLLGILIGADRLYLGQKVLGTLKLVVGLTFWTGIGLIAYLIWWIMDLTTTKKRTKKYNLDQFNKTSAFYLKKRVNRTKKSILQIPAI